MAGSSRQESRRLWSSHVDVSVQTPERDERVDVYGTSAATQTPVSAKSFVVAHLQLEGMLVDRSNICMVSSSNFSLMKCLSISTCYDLLR